MKKSAFWTLGALLAVIPLFTLAQSARELYSDAGKSDAKVEKRLNTACQQLVKQVQTNNKERAEAVVASLREAQRAWLKYREAQIQFVGMYNDIGSASARAAGLSTYNVELTQARIKELEDVPDPF